MAGPARTAQQKLCQSTHSELSIVRCTCTPHRQAHTHEVVSDADAGKLRSRLPRLARGRADDWSWMQQQQHTLQAGLPFSPPGRALVLLQRCSACDEAAAASTARSSMPAISEVIMGSRTAAPDDLAPLGMICCCRRGAWKDNERHRSSFGKRYLVSHLGVDPVPRATCGDVAGLMPALVKVR